TWAEMTRFLMSLMSGDRSADSVGGISAVYHNGISEEERKQKEEEERVSFEAIRIMAERDREFIEMARKALDLIANLVKYDPENSARIRRLQRLFDQKSNLDRIMTQVNQ